MDVDRLGETEFLSALETETRNANLDVSSIERNSTSVSAVAPLRSSTLPTIELRAVRQRLVMDSDAPAKLPFSLSVRELDSLETPQSFSNGAMSGIPSWLLSTILHLIALLILAVFTLSDESDRQMVVLEFTDSSEPFVLMSTDIVLEAVELEESYGLDVSESEAMEFENPDISFALMAGASLGPEESADLSLLDDLTGIDGDGMDGDVSLGESNAKAKFFGIRSYGKKFVFVIDCSGSMKGRRWRRAVVELKQAVDGLEENQEFLVLLYNTRTTVMLNADLQSAALSVATSDNKRQMVAWLKKQHPNGSTYPGPAVNAALRLKPDAIFLLSDGLLKDNTINWLRVWNPPFSDNGDYEVNNVIPVNTISLDNQGEWVMQTIANQNGGVFVSVR